MVEGISDLARLILDALERDDIACRVVLAHDGVEALRERQTRREAGTQSHGPPKKEAAGLPNSEPQGFD